MNEVEAMREQGDQIREALSCLKALQVDEDTYLKLSDVYNATKDILYPEGLTTEDEYKRLVAISKAGCKSIGYSPEEITKKPPTVSFSERGTYLKKRCSERCAELVEVPVEEMPIITDEIIATLIDELVTQDYEFINTPLTAIARSKLAPKLAHKHLTRAWTSLSESEQEHLIQQGDEVAQKLGYEVRTFDDPPWLAGVPCYAKPMTPDWDAWREAVALSLASRAYPKINVVIMSGLQAAFNNRVDKDPEKIISEQMWRELLDELGFIYEQEKNRLIPKPLNLEADTKQSLFEAISNLSTYNHDEIGDFLIKDDLAQAAKGVLGATISKGQLNRLITDGVVGRVLIKLGYEITTRWVSKYELAIAKKGAEVFTRTMQVNRSCQYPAFSKGFTIYSPALVRDGTDLVYMELLGPRQAVKANWASLRGHKKYHFFAGYRLEAPPDSKPTTLKTTLPCGWDHWCLIHRQASYEKLTPNETFYLINHAKKEAGPPSAFIAFLAKSLAIPILPEWEEYLWVEGRMKELITPLTKNCYGYGGWKVETDQWSQIVGEGLAEGHISF